MLVDPLAERLEIFCASIVGNVMERPDADGVVGRNGYNPSVGLFVIFKILSESVTNTRIRSRKNIVVTPTISTPRCSILSSAEPKKAAKRAVKTLNRY